MGGEYRSDYAPSMKLTENSFPSDVRWGSPIPQQEQGRGSGLHVEGPSSSPTQSPPAFESVVEGDSGVLEG